MKISEAIRALRRIQAKYGDLELFQRFYNDWPGRYLKSVDGIVCREEPVMPVESLGDYKPFNFDEITTIKSIKAVYFETEEVFNKEDLLLLDEDPDYQDWLESQEDEEE